MKKNCLNQLFNYSVICGLLIVLLGLKGCDDYAKKDIKYNATPNVTSVNMFVDETFQLRANPANVTFTWTSSDEKVAKVNSSGLVTAVGRGTADITARAGDLSCTVPVIAKVRIPLEDFFLNVSWIELAEGGAQEIKVIPIPTDANDMGYAEWTSDDTEIATVTYAGTIKCIKLGSTKVHCTINGITRSLSVKVSDILPFNGPHVLTADRSKPLIIAAKDFDFGGKGKAWWDSDSHDGDMKNYRKDRGDPGCTVDIESGQSPYNNIGWTNAGEWLLYSVDVMEAGEYEFDVYVAVNGNNKGYTLEINGTPIGKDYNYISWGSGYQNYRWYHAYPGNAAGPILKLEEGRQRIKYMLLDGNNNFSAIRLRAKE